MKKGYLFIIPLILCLLCKMKIQAKYAENIGIIRSDTQMYAAADRGAACLGEILKGSQVDIVSTMPKFTLVRYENQYVYIPNSNIGIYPMELGEKKPYVSPYMVLITEGNLYENAADMLMDAYNAVPQPIRKTFEEEGFLIKMTEWDITEEAYKEYGGYNGIGKILAVFDYGKKMLYVNDEYPCAIIHEMGHFVNDYLHMYSSRKDNLRKYKAEAEKLSSYAKENEREFFAESFRLYVSEPNFLWLVSPDTYVMVDEAVKFFEI